VAPADCGFAPEARNSQTQIMPICAKSLRGAALLASLAVSLGALHGAENFSGPVPASPDRYLTAVRMFADNVLALGTDH